MDELKRLNKILNLELAIVIIFIVGVGISVFLVFFQLTVRLDAITTQTESSEAVWTLRNILTWQSEFEVEFRVTGNEVYAQKFSNYGNEFDRLWLQARSNIILFEPDASFFYKSNNLLNHHTKFQAITSEIFSHTRNGTLDEADDLLEQHEILEGKMINLVNDWQGLNRINLMSLRDDANRFVGNIFLTGIFSAVVLSGGFITISRRFFSPFIRNLVENLTKRTEELEKTKKTIEKTKTALENKVNARTKELQKLTQNLEEQIKEGTRDLRSTNRELVKKSIELSDIGNQLEDKNIELKYAFNNLNTQNKVLVERSMDLAELQGKLEDKNFELHQANEEILDLMKARTELVNRAAHDLRTPITPILILLPTIRKRIKDREILYDISVIERNASYLKRIADNLISYLKAKTEDYNYLFKKTDIRKLIEEVLMIYKESFKQHKILLRTSMPKNLPLVELDDLKVTEVFQNIVSNAFKFMPKGGNLTINAKKMDNFINIEFKDTGIGMTEKTLSKVFGEFFKADPSRHFEGQGLGLSICKKIIEDHGGRIWAESRGPRKGSSILLNIPVSQKK